MRLCLCFCVQSIDSIHLNYVYAEFGIEQKPAIFKQMMVGFVQTILFSVFIRTLADGNRMTEINIEFMRFNIQQTQHNTIQWLNRLLLPIYNILCTDWYKIGRCLRFFRILKIVSSINRV